MKYKLLLACLLSCSTAFVGYAANSVANSDTSKTVDAYAGMGAAITSSVQNEMHNDNAKDWMKRTDVSVSFQKNYKPQYTIETVQPISHYDEQSNYVVLGQGRISNESDIGTTANMGIGYRRINDKETRMIGINTFYDYGFKRHHARVGGGIEYFVGQNEFRANVYKGVSGEKLIDATRDIFEKVVDGYDVSYGTTFKNARWARGYVEAYHWDFKHHDDQNGVRVGAELQITPNISIEGGINKATHRSSEGYGKIMYTLGKTDFALFGGKHSDDTVSTVRSKMLTKVRRNNNIVVERYQKDGAQQQVLSDSIHVSIRVN